MGSPTTPGQATPAQATPAQATPAQATPARASRARASRTRATRTKARKRAVDILFEAELRGGDPLLTLAERSADADPPVREFTADLVRGVVAHLPELDATIADHLADGWTLARLPRVDRAVLRMAVHELTRTDVPPDVVLAEAVALVGDLSTDESPAFVNAVLAAIGPGRSTAEHLT